MTAHLVRALQGALAMLMCAILAGVLVAFVPIWPSLNGRDFRLPGTMIAVLIFAVAIVLRGKLRWPVVDLLASLVCVETITLLIIAFFSGLTLPNLFDSFNLRWLGSVSLYIAPPWLAGLFIGGLMFHNRHERS